MILGYVGIAGSVIVIIFILLIYKHVYANMYEDIFLKIGGNVNVWGKVFPIMIIIISETYKYFSWCKGLMKLDLIINAEFMLTVFFLSYNVEKNYYVLGGNIGFAVLILFNNAHGHFIVSRVLICKIE